MDYKNRTESTFTEIPNGEYYVRLEKLHVKTKYNGKPEMNMVMVVAEACTEELQRELGRVWGKTYPPHIFYKGTLEKTKDDKLAQKRNCDMLASLKTGVSGIHYENPGQFQKILDQILDIAKDNMEFKVEYKQGKWYPYVTILEAYELK